MSTRTPEYFPDLNTRPRRELFAGVGIQVVSGEKLMLSRVDLSAGSVVPEHQHPHEQYGLVLEGEATFTVGGQTRHLRQGDYYAIPGGVLHSVVTGPGGAVCLDIFSPPREEYK